MPSVSCPSAPWIAISSVVIVAAWVATGTVRAEKILMSPEEMKKIATHVVVGKVKAIYTYESKDDSWHTWFNVAEVRVEKVEKGSGVEAGQLIYVRFWNRKWISQLPPGPNTNGHTGMAEIGQNARYYLVNKGYDGAGENTDGGFNVVFRNGCEVLKNVPERNNSRSGGGSKWPPQVKNERNSICRVAHSGRKQEQTALERGWKTVESAKTGRYTGTNGGSRGNWEMLAEKRRANGNRQ